MSLFKCKMCGGSLEITGNETVAECEYCGTKQTLPKLDDEKRVNMYDRANHFRRNNEFDKAMGIYEQILNEDSTDAEAYWSLVLCRYGIEYVEDPASHKRVPTVNRAQYTSVFDDDNYRSALQYADSLQKSVYEDEARVINEIQKGILAISQNEEPFDVFICYKETDNSGRRTPDSVLANDLYHQLTQEGFKVFFARITLEDKLGQEYEPYIFAALNSAKVMVVLGTKPEYFSAVWVKNEWSRYLSLIRSGERKMLVPAYKDMDPYDLPEEFSHLQAQDMTKLGFMQDLIRGIKKIIGTDEPKTAAVVTETVVTSAANSNIAPLLKRVFIFLSDRNWESADEYCEKVLDIDPECAEAYLGKLMAEYKISKRENLKDCDSYIEESKNIEKAYLYGDDALKKELDYAIDMIGNKKQYQKAKELSKSYTYENLLKASRIFRQLGDYSDSAALADECIESIYQAGVKAMSLNTEEGYHTAINGCFSLIKDYKDSAELIEKSKIAIKELHYQSAKAKMDSDTESEYVEAISIFNTIKDYKDSEQLIEECNVGRKECIYKTAVSLIEENNTFSYQSAKTQLMRIPDWRNSKELIEYCDTRIEEIHDEAEKQKEIQRVAREKAKKKAKRTALIICSIVVAVIIGIILFLFLGVPAIKRHIAEKLLSEGKYDEGYAIIMELDGQEAVDSHKYERAKAHFNNKEFDKAIEIFTDLDDYLDSEDRNNESKYQKAMKLLEEKNYDEAYKAFFIVYHYSDSKELLTECKYRKAVSLMDNEKYDESIAIFEELSDYSDSKEKIMECKYNKANSLMSNKKIDTALSIFLELGNYKDCPQKIKEYCLKSIETGKIGDSIFLGSYEQDNNISNNKEVIEWIVLDKQDNKLLVLSKYAIDCIRFNSDYAIKSWENCTLRKWMNGEFINTSFTKDERSLISIASVPADSNPNYDTDCGNSTEDHVFLLSIQEINTYKHYTANCIATKYARYEGCKINESDYCMWWLRTMGMIGQWASYANSNGVSYTGASVVSNHIGVRPAMWIDLSKI